MMKKRGQITLILAVIIFIIIIIGLFYYIKSYNIKKQSTEIIKQDSEGANTNIVKAYAENCLKKAGEEALFRVGEHGGYINPNGDGRYGEPGVPASYPTTLFLGENLPYYIGMSTISEAKSYKKYAPDLSEISKKLANYIAVEFEKCFNASVFESISISITKPVVDYQAVDFDFSRTDAKIDVSLNENDVSIILIYPLIVKEAGTETKLDAFRVTLPTRLKALYESAALLVEKIKNSQPNEYSIKSDCGAYDKNGLTNVYLKNSDNAANEVIQFVDFSTYKEKYFKSYMFEFAVKDVNVSGNCVG